jgi:seryl-tRNA synthetase
MIDLTDLRARPEVYKEATKQKGYSVDIDKLLELDALRRQKTEQLDELRQARNELSASAKNQRPSDEQIAKGKELKEQIATFEEALAPVETEFTQLYKRVPNLPEADVPVGMSEDENVESKVWGEKPQFDFEPKNHWQIAEQHDWIDKERAAKVSGSRFAYLKGGVAQLQFALVQYVLNTLSDAAVIEKVVSENNLTLSPKPFVPIVPPVMIRGSIYEQMDRLDPRDDRYRIESEDDLWLIGSAEHTLGSMYADEILVESELPIRYVGYSTSFRQEAGTYGKDMEGIIRMHQFDKLEMEVFSTAETGRDEHLLLIALQEYMVQQLGLPYHVLTKCTADIGKPNARGVDVEVWFPSQNKYRETHTADYMTDYQTRRLSTRIKKLSGNTELAHTNDATAFAMGRTIAAIIENYQTADGNVRIPDALKAYMGGRELL